MNNVLPVFFFLLPSSPRVKIYVRMYYKLNNRMQYSHKCIEMVQCHENDDEKHTKYSTCAAEIFIHINVFIFD